AVDNRERAAIQNTLELAGLLPEAIETKISSSSRFISQFYSDIAKKYSVGQDLIIIDFDYQSLTFSYFDENPAIIKKIHSLSLGYNLFLKELSVNLDLDEKKSADLLKNYYPDQPSSYPIEEIIRPLLKEMIQEINRFVIFKKPSLIFFTGEIVNFPSLINLIQKQISEINIQILNPAFFLKENSLTKTISYELPFYFSVVGTDLR
ncbi:MAG: hypothetical protein NZM02_00920, partial [Patescibacteria group bacterium]|nr:hypothetical protein [Patescibacteria group bacterium]